MICIPTSESSPQDDAQQLANAGVQLCPIDAASLSRMDKEVAPRRVQSAAPYSLGV